MMAPKVASIIEPGTHPGAGDHITQFCLVEVLAEVVDRHVWRQCLAQMILGLDSVIIVEARGRNNRRTERELTVLGFRFPNPCVC